MDKIKFPFVKVVFVVVIVVVSEKGRHITECTLYKGHLHTLIAWYYSVHNSEVPLYPLSNIAFTSTWLDVHADCKSEYPAAIRKIFK